MKSTETTHPAGAEVDALAQEVATLIKENAALKDQLNTLAELQLRTIKERDAARENFLGAMAARDAALTANEKLLERLQRSVG